MRRSAFEGPVRAGGLLVGATALVLAAAVGWPSLARAENLPCNSELYDCGPTGNNPVEGNAFRTGSITPASTAPATEPEPDPCFPLTADSMGEMASRAGDGVEGAMGGGNADGAGSGGLGLGGEGLLQ